MLSEALLWQNSKETQEDLDSNQQINTNKYMTFYSEKDMQKLEKTPLYHFTIFYSIIVE